MCESHGLQSECVRVRGGCTHAGGIPCRSQTRSMVRIDNKVNEEDV